MLRNIKEYFCRSGLLALVAIFALMAFATPAGAQTQTMKKVSGTTQVADPVFREYRGVTIGMSAVDVRAKLGAPKETSTTQDYYARSDNEFV